MKRQAHAHEEAGSRREREGEGRLWELMNVSIPKPLALRESRYLSDYAGQSSSAIQRYRSFSGEFLDNGGSGGCSESYVALAEKFQINARSGNVGFMVK